MPNPITRRDAAFDLAGVVAAIALAWAFSRLLLYPALNVPDNAPVILRPIAGFLVAWWLLHRRGAGWAALGLRMPSSWPRAILGGAALYLANWAISRWAVPVIAQLVPPAPQGFFLGYVRGNSIAFLGWLAIGVIVGGFMEEALFRGFFTTRVADLLGGTRAGLAVGIVAQAVLFGSLHLYAGAFAFVHATLFALANGVFYLVVGRNLWPLIVVHAIWNTVAIWGIYASR